MSEVFEKLQPHLDKNRALQTAYEIFAPVLEKTIDSSS